MRRVLKFLVSLGLSLSISGQTPSFHAEVTNIHVDVAVVENHRLISGLQQADFQVRDNDEVQPIVAFAEESVPVSLALMLDFSGSMRRSLAELAEESRSALRQLRSEDRVAVIGFSYDARLEEDFTADVDAVVATIKRLASKGPSDVLGTHINNAVIAATQVLSQERERALRRGEARRYAILMLTDNLPTGHIADELVIPRLLDADTVLNAIVIRREHHGKLGPLRDQPGTQYYDLENVFDLAQATGGEALFSTRAKGSLADMISRIRTRYSIWYRPPWSQPGAFRRIRVELTEAARSRYPDAEIKARRGYYAN
jgi:Ca-activated chloride channel family protein